MRSHEIILTLLLVLSLTGCLSVGTGPLQIGPSTNRDVPLLYADPGVRVVRTDVGEVAYHAGLPLRRGDIVTTSGGQAVIDFDQQNIVALQSNTSIQLGSVRLFFGELFARIEQLTSRGGARVLTNELNASVEGTEYAVRRRPTAGSSGRASTQVIVRVGTVLCEPAAGATWRARSLTRDQMLGAYRGASQAQIQTVDARAQTRWADQTIQRLLEPRRSIPTFSIPIPFGTTPTGRKPMRSYRN